MSRFKSTLKDISKYPSAIAGLIIIFLMVIASITIVIKIPYDTAIAQWRGGEEIWGRNPRNVPPTWYNVFRKDKLVESLDLTIDNEEVTVEERSTEGGTRITTTTFPFDYSYSTFPQDIVFYFKSSYTAKQPYVSIYLITPDEREIKIGNFGLSPSLTYPLSQDAKLKKKLGGISPEIGLFVQEEMSRQVVPRTINSWWRQSTLRRNPQWTLSL